MRHDRRPPVLRAQQKPNRAPKRAQQMLLVADRLTRHHDQADRLIDDLLAHTNRHPVSVPTTLNRPTKLSPPLVQRVRDLLRRERPPPTRRAHKPPRPTTAHQRQTHFPNTRRSLSRRLHQPVNASWSPRATTNLKRRCRLLGVQAVKVVEIPTFSSYVSSQVSSSRALPSRSRSPRSACPRGFPPRSAPRTRSASRGFPALFP